MTTEPAPRPTGAALLREPFPPHHISKLPKETKKQREERENNRAMGVSCKVCGGWHHKNAVHLDYVGHAALTDRLLDADPNWSWEPVAFRDGLPAFDQTGGLWIRLTVDGLSRLGYGHAAAKQQMDPGAREKEVIGDALRNAAMRFGAALDLWHKGDLHLTDGDPETVAPPPDEDAKPKSPPTLAERADALADALTKADEADTLERAMAKGSNLCAELDLKDPDRLAEIVSLYERRRDDLDTTPFAKAA